MITSHPGKSSYESLMSEDKKPGMTQVIRQKLGFTDDRLWKRLSARRLELIDALDLSSKKASEQEEEISKVAEILRVEFHYDLQYYAEFDQLVKVAVQSARRNRKRASKTGRANVKRRSLDSESHSEPPSTANSSRKHSTSLGSHPDIHPSSTNNHSGGSEKNSFLSEITNLNADGFDSIYDMSYSTSRIISTSDRSRAAIDSIIKPANIERKLSNPGIKLPPLSNVNVTPRHQENEKVLSTLRSSLLWLMKRSKSCLSSASSHMNESLKTIGQSSITAANALMLESSFSELSHTSVEYLRERISSEDFQARFYRSLDPECPVSSSLDNETAVSTLQTLVGCCVKDFGFDSVLYLIGDASYLLILQEYPLVSRSSVPFRRTPDALQVPMGFQRDPVKGQPASLSNLAAIASELRSQAVTAPTTPNTSPSTTSLQPAKPSTENYLRLTSIPTDAETDRKQVKLRFLSSSLNFTFPMKNSAPPRFVEIVDNARQAFKLNDNQVYGLRNSKSGLVINTDFDLEQIFSHEQEIELEVFTQKFTPIPICEITSAITPSPSTDDRAKIVLPLPVRQNIPPVLRSPIDPSHSPGYPRAALLPKFQPLL
ncbi:hypothetical protein JCM33374_g1845 [Metschnikowia sp. JCM 33374]|nr:hypothetical protein JCM33374_g1845 [Metschnikowia sp. JCM 33374]